MTPAPICSPESTGPSKGELTTTDPKQRRLFAVVVSILVGLLMCQLVSLTPAQAAPDPCGAIIAEGQALLQRLSDIQARIQDHNAESVNRYSKAAVDAYNARADQLESEKNAANAQVDGTKARLNNCAQAIQAIKKFDPRDPDFRTDPPQSFKNQFDGVNDANVKQNKAPNGKGTWEIPREYKPLVKMARENGQPTTAKSAGDIALRGVQRPRPGEKDPAYENVTDPQYADRSKFKADPNNNSLPLASVDHIVPLAQIVNMPGFTRLNAQNKWLVLNAPPNLSWLSRYANTAKNSGSYSRITGANPNWIRENNQLQAQIAAKIQESITKLLASQT